MNWVVVINSEFDDIRDEIHNALMERSKCSECGLVTDKVTEDQIRDILDNIVGSGYFLKHVPEPGDGFHKEYWVIDLSSIISVETLAVIF